MSSKNNDKKFVANKPGELLVRPIKTSKFTSTSPAIKLQNAELIALWDRTEQISSKNPNVFRLDPAQALIKLSEYGKTSAHGWVAQPIDLEHVPINVDINHLVAIHWMNAESRLKTNKKNGTSFLAVVTRVVDPISEDNVRKDKVIQNKTLHRQNSSAIWSKKEPKGSGK